MARRSQVLGSVGGGYAAYMQLDRLLSCQGDPTEYCHPDELLFRCMHQGTELVLKPASYDIEEAARQVRVGALDRAAGLLVRSSMGVKLATGFLEILSRLNPADFARIRSVLVGSGAESPGWRSVGRAGRDLGRAFDDFVASNGVDLAALYREGPATPLYNLAEAMIELDECVTMWQARHFVLARRIIGADSVGTQGTPVAELGRRLSRVFFPQLWRVRADLISAEPSPGPPTLTSPASPRGEAETKDGGW